ncbi:MAG: hypothetical protein DI635_15035 [Pseudoxanthomonas suwonensis]|nr:MAG: hypothetical protein DI635_15035 [Pseudoxanthomonas suwonensis]
MPHHPADHPRPLPAGVGTAAAVRGAARAAAGRPGPGPVQRGRRPVRSLELLGAGRATTFFYGVVPMVTGRFTAYALYRWEIAIRETVVVGVVGAGGLGRVLESQRASFDYSGMLTVVIALLVLSLLVDLASASARRAWR